jgi:deoxyribodipyrimidine photo-lyase
MNIIWWIRRDLRLYDNEALAYALEQGEAVLPIFILDPALLNSQYVGEKRLAFLYGGLRQLHAALRERGSRLIVRRGQPRTVLADLLQESQSELIVAEADHSPYAKTRDTAVAQTLPLRLVGSTAVRLPGAILKRDGDPYIVYTPFKKGWLDLPLPQRSQLHSTPAQIDTPAKLESDPIPNAPALPDSVPFPPGEAEGLRRLQNFVSSSGRSVYDYAEQRNRMDLDGTSRLSPYLRFGMVSPRLVAVEAIEARSRARTENSRKGALVWLQELIWRDFYIHILHHFPHVAQGNFDRQYDRIAWRDDEAGFAAWCEGRTGYPVVDAAMRQLVQSGWMHNRARMIVASFLVKDLLIDWRQGEQFFKQHLVDGDLASNNGGWQWTAGTGTDAAPYFRIFNPTLQAKKFDPHGDFIRRWLPELVSVPDKFIHEPEKMNAVVQRRANCRIGEDYPAPIVDHHAIRDRTLAAYKEAREAEG